MKNNRQNLTKKLIKFSSVPVSVFLIEMAKSLQIDKIIKSKMKPAGNLDSKSGTDIKNLLKELNQKGITIILVTYDNYVASYAFYFMCLFLLFHLFIIRIFFGIYPVYKAALLNPN